MNASVLQTNQLKEILGLPSISHDSSPGAFAIKSQWNSLKQSFGALGEAIRNRDLSQIWEQGLRAINLNFGIASSVDRFLRFSTVILTGVFISTVSIIGATCGFIFLAIQFVLETSRIMKIKKFNRKNSLNDTEILEKLYTKNFGGHLADEPRKRKINKLAKIFQLQGLNALYSAIILPKVTEKPATLKFLSSQMEKALFVHYIGLAAISCAMISLALSIALFPPAAVLSTGILGMAFEFFRSAPPDAYLERFDAKWDYKMMALNYLPSCVRRSCNI